jgi:glycosyltransferase involved in cell wall biosynthesis
MRIAQLAPLEETVPPGKYGGTELIVSLLTEELINRNHKVTLFACGRSKSKAQMVSIIDHPLRSDESGQIRRWSAYDLRQLLELKAREKEFDIIHNHMGYISLPFIDQLACPSVTTLHNLVEEYCRDIFLAYKHLPYVAISSAFKNLNSPDQLNYAATIYNGIDLDCYPFETGKTRTYLLFLGRVSKDKGTREAIEIAKALRLPLKIAGKVDPADRAYFEKEVEPLLNDRSIQFVGEVDQSQKVSLYQEAIAVVYPINFEEPFGLVMAESLALGTPVMATALGAVPEIIIDGKTGIVADSVEKLISRFGEIKNISPKDCRKQAEKFSSLNMTTEYEKLYDRLKK